MANWTAHDVIQWLELNGFQKQVKLFQNLCFITAALEKGIDGEKLINLTEDDISSLFLRVNEDGTVEESTIGAKSRFRTQLNELKKTIKEEVKQTQNDSRPPTSISTGIAELNNDEVPSKNKKSAKKYSKHDKYPVEYLIDDEIQVLFFHLAKFRTFFIDFIKKETFLIDIELSPHKSYDGDGSPDAYIIKLNGTKNENRAARNLIRQLLESIKCRIYSQIIIKKWIINHKSIPMVQSILDSKTQLFTVCQISCEKDTLLKIHYFDNEKFNLSQNLSDIDTIVQIRMFQQEIRCSSVENLELLEFVELKTKRVLSSHKVCPKQEYQDEFNRLIDQYDADQSFMSISRSLCGQYAKLQKRSIEIFGYEDNINEFLEKFKNLIDKYRLRKFKFTHITPEQLECLAQLCSQEFHEIEREFRSDCIQLYIRQNEFYAPQYLKKEIQMRLTNLLSNLKSITYKTEEIYYNKMTDEICSKIKNIVTYNNCYCELNLKRKTKSCIIPKSSNQNYSSIDSQTISDESNSLCFSSNICFETKFVNGSIGISLGDISLQKTDYIIIPSMSFGLKEYLFERAENINEVQSNPFITETTAGKLESKRILFVNWSIPTRITNENELDGSIQFFIAKIVQYVLSENEKTNSKQISISIAVPDSCQYEEILAEEMIAEAMNQILLINDLILKVSFVILSDQKSLYQNFFNTLKTIQKADENLGIFDYSASTIKITLVSLFDESLKKCKDKIDNYLKQSLGRMKLNGFENWNQNMINSFFKRATEKFVLPVVNERKEIYLYGPIEHIHDINEKYQLTNTIINEKMNVLIRSSNSLTLSKYKILFVYSPDDLDNILRLSTRLIDEGFHVSTKLNQTTDSDEIHKKIRKANCVIFCLSKISIENDFCIKLGQFAYENDKSLIPVRVEYCQLTETLPNFIKNEYIFQLFGSDNHFYLEYDKLLLKILKKMNHNSSDIKTDDQAQFDFLLTLEQRKLKYERVTKTIKRLEKGKLTNNDIRDVDQIKDMVQKKEKMCEQHLLQWRSQLFYESHKEVLMQLVTFDTGIISIKQWLEKIKNFKTKLNISPLTFTGDINDSVFPFFTAILKNPRLFYSIRGDHRISPSIASLSPQGSRSPSKRSSILKPIYKPKAKRISKTSSEGIKKAHKKRSSNSTSTTGAATNSKIKKSKGNERENLKRESMPNPEIVECKKKFAEIMKQNEIDFQNFCQTHEHFDYSSLNKSSIHSIAIFGPSPFSKVKVIERQTIIVRDKIELPLKFPWNGVFEKADFSVKWEKPSILFHFHAPTSTD